MISNVVIDLSHWNVNVDFGLIKKNGTIAVIHKATGGVKFVDNYYRTRRIAAEKEGLLWGAYHFGINMSGIDQANHFLNKVGSTKNTLLVLDIEPYKNKIMTPNQVMDFIKTVNIRTNNSVTVYGSYSILKKYSTPFLVKNPLWIAHYKKSLPIVLPGWDKWVLWQYTNNGSLPVPQGVGKCNKDKFNGSVDKLKKFWLRNH